jgi:hypothetical protein
MNLNFGLIIFSVITSILFALLEIQIEGESGWAAKLPTWKIKNPFPGLFNWPVITGYHIYLNLFIFCMLHLPFFVGLNFNLKNELLILEVFLSIIIEEDFLWFVLNPKWGIKKFFTLEIPWHAKKILYLPRNYWVAFLIYIILEVIRKYI